MFSFQAVANTSEERDPSLPVNAFEALALYRGAIEHYRHANLDN